MGGQPESPDLQHLLGNVLSDSGDVKAALAAYARVLEIKPDHETARSSRIFLLNYVGAPEDEYLREAKAFGQRAADRVPCRFTSWLCSERPARLRVGFVSADLREHPVGYFLENVIAALDLGRVELIAYANHPAIDALTRRIMPRFSRWRAVHAMNDATLARQIYADGMHILVDLAGHTAHNRLGVFSWKPAPVQATWLGYFATTGVAEIDYFLTDPVSLPESSGQGYVERIWQLPCTRLCFTPPREDVAPGPLPALASGALTFGCFSNLAKVSDETLALWAKLVKTVVGSRLFFKSPQLRNEAGVAALQRRLFAHGFDSDRVMLEAAGPREEYLAAYHRVDIVLDTFPYAGGTTTAESLWMGVPVITLAGDRLISRQGASMLHNAGLDDWAARSTAEYLALGIRHASDLPQLAELGAKLRARVLNSPLFDATAFARDLEAAWWGMWDIKTRGKSA